MEIKDMTVAERELLRLKSYTTEQLEKELEERKRVKPRATPESVKKAYVLWRKVQSEFEYEIDQLDWTPPKYDYELELVEGMPCLMDDHYGKWAPCFYYKGYMNKHFIPFNRSLVGKAVE